MKIMQKIATSFHREQRGSAMTEFVMTLPVWIVVLYVIWDMGMVHMHVTNTQIVAQTDLWSKAIPLTRPFDPTSGQSPDGESAQYMVPALGALKAGAAQSKARNAHNGHGNFSTIEGPVHALAIGGATVSLQNPSSSGLGDSHYVESTYRIGSVALGMSGVPETKLKAKDVVDISEEKRYPVMMLNDGLDTNFDFSGDSASSQVASILMSALDSSGALHSIVAGARYGAVAGESTGDYKGLFGWNVKPGYAYDTLVSPAPYTTDAANYIPMMVARLGAEAADGEKYAVALRFCKGDWSGNTPAGNSNVDTDSYRDDAEDSDEAQEAEGCEDDGFSSVDQCRACRADSCSSGSCPGYDLCTCNPSAPSCQPPPNP